MTTEQERLQQLMQHEELNAKDFAAEVGISAATMSNILGGRNKPSLEVMQKVLGRFRMVSPEWLILGVGTMYKLKQDAQEQTLFDVRPDTPEGLPASEPLSATIMQDTSAKTTKQPAIQIVERPVAKRVSKVVVFFEDGTFQEL